MLYDLALLQRALLLLQRLIYIHIPRLNCTATAVNYIPGGRSMAQSNRHPPSAVSEPM